MAACTLAIGTPDTGATPNTSGAFTPALNDLLIAFVVASGTVQATATLTSSLGGGFTFTQILRATFNSSADSIYAFVANQLVSSATSQTVTFDTASDGATGTNIIVYRVSGVTRTGLNAIRQSAKTDNLASGTLANVAFGGVCLTANPVICCVGNTANPAGMAPSTSGFTEPAGGDIGYNSPATGAAVMHRDSGFTGFQPLWTTGPAAHGSIGLEIDTSALSNNYSITAATGSFSYSGGDAGLYRGLKLPADNGSFSYAGGNANLAKGFAVQADGGVFNYSGADAALFYARVMLALTGSFAYVGGDAALGAALSIAAETGVFSYSGGSATLTEGAATGIDQEAFRFYADGTESGSSALAAQDANYTADLTAGNFILLLRARLKNNDAPGGLTPVTWGTVNNLTTTPPHVVQTDFDNTSYGNSVETISPSGAEKFFSFEGYLNQFHACLASLRPASGAPHSSRSVPAGYLLDFNPFSGNVTVYKDNISQGDFAFAGTDTWRLGLNAGDEPCAWQNGVAVWTDTGNPAAIDYLLFLWIDNGYGDTNGLTNVEIQA